MSSFDEPITISTDFSIGSNYKAKFGLVQIEFFYNSQLLSYPKIGVYEFKNLETSSKIGTYVVKGNYIGLGLIFSPKRVG